MPNEFYGLRRRGPPAVAETLSAERITEAVSWRTSDGEDGNGQTSALSLLAGALPDYEAYLLVLSDGDRTATLYYDVVGHGSTDGAGHLYELTGTQNRFFEEIFSDISDSAARAANATLSQTPATLWVPDAVDRDALAEKLQTFFSAAAELRQARRVLAQYGMTLIPVGSARLSGLAVTLTRDYRLQWRYPNDAQTAVNRRLKLSAVSVARPQKPRLADALNAPGLYASRPVIAGWREPGGQVRSYEVLPPSASLGDLRRVVVDVEQANRDVGLYAVHLRRWELQNDSVRCTFALANPDLRIGVNTLLSFEGDYALTGLPDYGGGAATTWRVAKVKRAHGGPEFHSTEVEAVLWQGLPGE